MRKWSSGGWKGECLVVEKEGLGRWCEDSWRRRRNGRMDRWSWVSGR